MTIKHDDRRQHARYGVFAGNAEITSIMGPKGARKPAERARIINWSRGGVLLRVPSPRRRLLFFKQEPLLGAEDMIKCILRLPPQYTDIDVSAEVVRVERCADDPDQLQVGVNFISIPADRLEAMARLLEPKPRPSVRAPRATSGRQSGRSGRAASQRVSQRVASQDAPPPPRHSGTKSQRLEARTSDRKKSQRKEATASQRLTMRQTETLEIRTSGRQSRVSDRL